MADEEPMLTVDGVTVPDPASFKWAIEDVSNSDAGRTEDFVMHKNRGAQKRKLTLGWSVKTWHDASVILRAFNPEYISVRYPDMLDEEFETRTFYAGSERTGQVKWWLNGENKRIGDISFSIIEQ